MVKEVPETIHIKGLERQRALRVSYSVERDTRNPILQAEQIPGAIKIYNPTVLQRQSGNLTHYDMFFREMNTGGISSIGHATSRDGVVFSPDSEPAIVPSGRSIDSHGIEDGRITQMDDGQIFMTATGFDGTTARAVITTPIDNSLGTWQTPEAMFPDWHGGRWNIKENRAIILGGFDESTWRPEDANWSKSAAIFPRKFNGKYYAFFGDDQIYLAISQDGRKWDVETSVISERPGFFDNAYVEMGPAPIELDEGWLVIYNGVNSFDPKRAYQVGAVIVDKNDPTKILWRSDTPILSAEGKERKGAVDVETNESGESIYQQAKGGELKTSDSSVVFCNGAVLLGKENDMFSVQLYYGSGDLFINTAKLRMKIE